MSNPLSPIHNALWAAAIADPILIALAEKNLINFNDNDAAPEKPQSADADFPTLVLMPAHISSPSLTANSCSADMTAAWHFITVSGQQSTNVQYDLQWGLFRAIMGFKRDYSGLSYDGQDIIKKITLVGGSTVMGDPKRDKQIKGWSCLWRVDILLRFLTAKILEEYDA